MAARGGEQGDTLLNPASSAAGPPPHHHHHKDALPMASLWGPLKPRATPYVHNAVLPNVST